MSIEWTEQQLRDVGVPRRKLESLVRKLRQCSDMMRELRLQLYGCDGTGYLIHESRPEHDSSGNPDFGAIVAKVGEGFGGGGW